MRTARRSVLGGALATLALPAWAADETLATIERRTGGRLGVAVLDTGSGRRLQHRAHERFPMCSTFKFLLATLVLKRIDAGEERADRIVPYGEKDLLEYAPITRKHVAQGGMSVTDLCAAAVTVSDNTAANLLLATIGGPAGWTRFARSLGDDESRLDRIEPELNRVPPGDVRDTTTPAAMLADMRRVLFQPELSQASKALLEGWMRKSAVLVGGARLRAGIPPDWAIADKTGTGRQASNEIALLKPPGRASVLATVYIAYATVPGTAQDAAIADVGRLIARSF